MKTPSTPIDDPAAATEALREEARIWLSRLAGAEPTQMDVQAFQRWQRTSPAHAAAFDEARRQWASMRLALGGLLRTDPKIAARHERLRHGASAQPGRRAFLGAAAGAAVAAGVVAVVHPPLGLWPAAGEWRADERTATGEQRQLVLARQVRVTLNTQTSVRRQAEGLELIAGEAAIDLPAECGAPFVVSAGAGRALAGGDGPGRFELSYLQGKACLSCLEGTVRLEHPAGTRQLQARQQLVYDAQAISGVRAIEPADLSAWRRGELVFRQTPLARVVDEINRYRPGRVVLLAASRRDDPVSGRFSIAVLDEALLQIQHSFGLQARSLPGGLLVLS